MRKKKFSRAVLLQKLRSRVQARTARRARFNLKSEAERAEIRRRVIRVRARVRATYRRLMYKMGFVTTHPTQLKAIGNKLRFKKMPRATTIKPKRKVGGFNLKFRVGLAKIKPKADSSALRKLKPRLFKKRPLRLFLRQQILKRQKSWLRRYYKSQELKKKQALWQVDRSGKVKLRPRGSPINWERYNRWVARRQRRRANPRWRKKRRNKTPKYFGYMKWRLSRHGRKMTGRKTTQNWLRRKRLSPHWWKRGKFYARWFPEVIPRCSLGAHPSTFHAWQDFVYSDKKETSKVKRLNFRPYVLRVGAVRRLGNMLYKRYRCMLHNAKWSSTRRVSDLNFLGFMCFRDDIYYRYYKFALMHIYKARFKRDKWPFVPPAAALKYARQLVSAFTFSGALRTKLMQDLLFRWRGERLRFWMSKLWLRYYSWPHIGLFSNRRFKLRFRRFKYYTRLKKRILFKDKVVPVFYVLNFLLSKTNLFITLTDLHGRVLFLETAGKLGFAGRQKRSSDAAIQMIKVVYKKFIGMLTEKDTVNKTNFFENQPAHKRVYVLPWHYNRRLPSLKWRLIVRWKGGFLHKVKRYYGFLNKLWERTRAKRYYLGCARSQRKRPMYIFPQLTRQGSFSYPIRRRKKNKGRNRRVKEILLARGRRKKGYYQADVKITARLRVQRRRTHRAKRIRRYWFHIYRRAFYLRKALAGLGRRVPQAYALYYAVNKYPFIRRVIYKRRTGRWGITYPKKRWEQWAGSWQSEYVRHKIPILHYADTLKYTAPIGLRPGLR